jgi:hypothetical protein
MRKLSKTMSWIMIGSKKYRGSIRLKINYRLYVKAVESDVRDNDRLKKSRKQCVSCYKRCAG